MNHIDYKTVAKWFRQTKEKPVTDRISQMSREELEAATRALLRCSERIADRWHHEDLSRALWAFNPTTLDKVRELLLAEGWKIVDSMGRHGEEDQVTLQPKFCGQQCWEKP